RLRPGARRPLPVRLVGRRARGSAPLGAAQRRDLGAVQGRHPPRVGDGPRPALSRAAGAEHRPGSDESDPRQGRGATAPRPSFLPGAGRSGAMARGRIRTCRQEGPAMATGGAWRREVDRSGTWTLWLDRPGSSQNSLDLATLDALDDYLRAA